MSRAGAPRRRTAAALAVLTAGVAVAITVEVLPVGLLPQLSAGLGVDAARTGVLVSAYAVVVAAASLPLTALVGRWPRRWVLGGLLATYAASAAVTAATSSWAVALGARVVAGAAHAAFFSLVFATAAALVPPERAGRAVAVASAGVTVGLAGGLPAATALGHALGWRWAFAAAGAAVLVLAAVTAAVVPALGGPTGPAGAPLPRPAPDAVALGPALRGRSLLVVGAGVAVVMLGHYTAYTYVTPLLHRAGVAPAAVAAVLLGYGAASAVGLAAAGALRPAAARAGMVTGVGLLAACLLALALAGAGRGLAVTAVVVWGAVFGALLPLLQGAARAAAAHPDAGPAVVNAAFNAGIAGGGLVGGRELAAVGPAALPLTGAALAVVGAVLLGAGARPRPGGAAVLDDRDRGAVQPRS